jgi:hypothetical protein
VVTISKIAAIRTNVTGLAGFRIEFNLRIQNSLSRIHPRHATAKSGSRT